MNKYDEELREARDNCFVVSKVAYGAAWTAYGAASRASSKAASRAVS